MIRIMQYCDGTLSPREAAAVAEEITRDPEAAQLAAELSAGAQAARLAWSDLEAGPVPLDLARRVNQAARSAAPGKPSSFRALDLRFAAALLIGCVLGALGLALVQQGGDPGLRLAGTNSAGDDAWAPALMVLLSKDSGATEGGAPMAFGDAAAGKSVRIARWFNTATGRRCAEFLRMAEGSESGGIACRKSDGSWDVIDLP